MTKPKYHSKFLKRGCHLDISDDNCPICDKGKWEIHTIIKKNIVIYKLLCPYCDYTKTYTNKKIEGVRYKAF